MKKNIPPLQPDCFYHVYNRGINGENIFKEERNYAYFLQKYAQFASPFVETYAYCLLKNHFHVLVRTRPEAEVKLLFKDEAKFKEKTLAWHYSNAFASLFKSYAQAINKGYKRTGALFEEPFRRIPVETNDYLREMVYYIHHNPKKHKFTADFRQYPHSSFHALMSKSPTKLNRDELLSWFGGVENLERYLLDMPLLRHSKDLEIEEEEDE